MERILFLNRSFCAVCENGRLTEYIPCEGITGPGDIVIGKVDRIMAGLNSAFVDIGRKKDGFLPLHENSRTFTDADIRSGDRVIVQVRREETGDKGAFLTRDITLAGEYLILMPQNRHVGVSARITDESVRTELIKTGRMIADGRFGLVLRSAAAGVPYSMLQDEAEALRRRWEDAICDHSSRQVGDTVLRADTAAQELINDYRPRGISGIIADEDLGAELKRQLRAAADRTVQLPNGGNIVIDRCEALTVIDVNTASAGNGKTKRETVLETDLEACEEIVTQIRLRNISGIIIIDMIDLDDGQDRQKVLELLNGCLENDRIKTVIHGFTSLGLIEMTRKRSRTGLGEMLKETRDETGQTDLR